MHLPSWTTQISPLANTLSQYRRDQFIADLIAGIVVAVMLVPQAMAYAMLAGLPPQVGLYASILPLVLYALFGTSRSLSVGPVAMVSLLVVSGVGEMATPGSEAFIQLCLTLSLMVGLLHLLLAAFRLGFLVNFISHPVLIGFTSAAAIVIGFSQLKHLFGISVEAGEYPIQLIANTLMNTPGSNLVTLAIGLASGVLLIFFHRLIAFPLQKFGFHESIISNIAKTGPLVAVVVAAYLVFVGNLHETQSVAIVGSIPSGLPVFSWPEINGSSIGSLFPLALVITLVGYLESISVSKALASRHREKVDANRELFALGMANVGASISGGYPVTGGFSRSMVNDAAGVQTPIGSIITALLVLVSVLFLTPLFYYIPRAVLAAIVVVAVLRLIDLKSPVSLWKYSRADAIALMITFVAVLGLGIEKGILIGIATTIILLMGKMSRPHVAVVGRVERSEQFRNIDRHKVQTVDGLLAFRVDESLNFANAPFLETFVQSRVSEDPNIQTILLVGSSINDIDATGMEVLKTIRDELDTAGVQFFMSDIKGPVSDRLRQGGFDKEFLRKNIFLSAHQAVEAFLCKDSQRKCVVPPEEKAVSKSDPINYVAHDFHYQI